MRVVTRLLKRAVEEFGFEDWSDHRLQAKRRMWEICLARNQTERRRLYPDLLKVAGWARAYGRRAILFLKGGIWETTDERRRAHRLAGELRHSPTSWTGSSTRPNGG